MRDLNGPPAEYDGYQIPKGLGRPRTEAEEREFQRRRLEFRKKAEQFKKKNKENHEG